VRPYLLMDDSYLLAPGQGRWRILGDVVHA
jgi:hypothetical protein